MINQRYIKNLVLTLSFVLFSLISLGGTAHSEQTSLDSINIDKRILNVAVLKINYIPYLIIENRESIYGIYPSYIENLAQLLNMQVHYQLYDSVAELENAMELGNADVFFGSQFTEARQNYLVMSKPIFSTPRTLLVAKEVADEPINLSMNEKIKLAIFQYDIEKYYIEENFPAISKFSLDKYSEIVPALKYGLANAHLSDSLTNQYLASILGEKGFSTLVLEDLPKKIWHIPFSKNNAKLNLSLNQLITHMDQVELSAILSKTNQGKNYNATPSMIVTPEEKNWLYQNSTLRYTTLPGLGEAKSLDPKGGPKGLPISVLNQIAKLLGISIEYIPSSSTEHALELMKNGDVDVIPAVLKVNEVKGILNFSEPYFSAAWDLITLSDRQLDVNQLREGKYKIASSYTGYAEVVLKQHFKNSELIRVGSMSESLKLLEKNEVDVVFSTLLPAHLWLEKDTKHIYKLLPNLYINNRIDVRLGVSQNSPLLPNLINQALKVIGHEELEELARSWVEINTEKPIDFSHYILPTLIAFAIFLIVLFGSLYWNHKLRNEVALRKAIEKRVKTTEQKLTSTANTIPGAVVKFTISDEQLIFSYASKGIEELTPIKKIDFSEELEVSNDPYNFFTLISQEQKTQLLNAAKGAINDKHELDIECQLLPPYEQWLNLVAFPTFEGGDCEWSGVLLEINQRKQQELALNEAKNKAEYAVKAKSDFLAMMSHEIRTPLSGVISTTELLAQSKLDYQQRNDINTIISSANNLLHILNDVLDHTKMETQQFTVEEIECDLLSIVEDAIRIHIANIHTKKLKLKLYFAPSVNRFVTTDPTRLQQILSNLISNAVKFTEKGSIDVFIEPISIDNNEQRICFKVKDTGLGIAPESQADLFVPFKQAESSTNRKFGGSGLGLSICRMLVERLHGNMYFNSVLGIGSEFVFELPLKAYLENKLPISNYRILVVDDGSEFIKLIKQYFQQWQVNFMFESNLDEQITWLNSNQEQACIIIYHLTADLLTLKSKFNHYSWVKLCDEENDEYGANHYLSTNPLLASALIDLITNETTATTAHSVPQPAVVKELQTELEAIQSGQLILVAEDHPTNRKVLKRQLESLGYYADYVENGLEALEAINSQQYNLLLTDCHMPEMDGYELTEQLRSSGSTIPIIAYTANALIGEAQRCIELGMNDYITKPVSLHVLKKKLHTYLSPPQRSPLVSSKPLLIGNTNEKLEFKFNNLKAMFGSIEVVWELLDEFIVSCKIDIEELNKMNFTTDFKQVGNVAHRLKGAAQMVCADRLCEIAIELQQAANQQSSSLCINNLKALSQTLSEYESSLLNEINGNPSSSPA